MRNYEAMRGGHKPRDIYAELRRIEERGKRLKNKQRARFHWPFRMKSKNADKKAVSSL